MVDVGRWGGGEDKYVGKATTVDNTVIDYMISSSLMLGRVKQFYVHDFDCLMSDKHCIVEMVLGGNHKTHKEETVIQDDIGLQDSIRIDGPETGKWRKPKD